jgi:3-methyladenine DNA glycosylase AlkD
MKSEMPYHGIPASRLKQVLRPLLAAYAPDSRSAWEATVRELWDDATHREERYAATALARHRAARPWQDPKVLGLHRHLVVTGAWWDHVDELASRRIGPVLLAHRSAVAPVMRAWSTDADRWRRRTSVICQLAAKQETDRALLRDCLLANLDDCDFFLRKAIGWALRQYARVEPEWVLAFVAEHRDRMSPLSVREATKHL